MEKCNCDDEIDYPQYGVAPHDCYYKIGKQIGQSNPHNVNHFPDNFSPDFGECSTQELIDFIDNKPIPLCGVYYCPTCRNGLPPINAIYKAKKYLELMKHGK